MNKEIYPGRRFGKLVAASPTQGHNWLFDCDCGSTKEARKYDVMAGKIVSCGCNKIEKIIARNKAAATHGMSHTPTWQSWQALMTRCYNKNSDDYAEYGAAGIVACEFIRCSPANLLSLLGKRPPRMSIDRINNFLGYYCGQCAECLTNNFSLNVRWATAKQQGRNQRTNHLLTIGGKTQCIAEWADESGIPCHSIRNRIKRGWPEQHLTAPLFTRKRGLV